VSRRIHTTEKKKYENYLNGVVMKAALPSLICAITAIICSVILANGFTEGMRTLSVGIPSPQNGWTVQRETEDGWTLLDKDTGRICTVSPYGPAKCLNKP
jgi:hypothetical protein